MQTTGCSECQVHFTSLSLSVMKINDAITVSHKKICFLCQGYSLNQNLPKASAALDLTCVKPRPVRPRHSAQINQTMIGRITD